MTNIVVPLQQHDYRSEQPVTIWTEIRDRAHVSNYFVTYSRNLFHSVLWHCWLGDR